MDRGSSKGRKGSAVGFRMKTQGCTPGRGSRKGGTVQHVLTSSCEVCEVQRIEVPVELGVGTAGQISSRGRRNRWMVKGS